MLAFLVGDRVLPFPSESFLLGSGAGCALRLSQLEARHAEVFLEEGTWLIRDISGTSTLRVNGVATLEAKIDDGSHLTLGGLKLTVRVNKPVEDQTFIPAGGNVLTNGLVIDGRYQILKKIAAGGMGAVYAVEHLELGKKLAMKVMLPELSRDPDFVTRFKREAVASSRIGHQNIIAISDFGRTQDGRFYFVMEHLDGVTLAELVRSEGAQRGERVIAIALQIARALATAHQAGIIHRDLKPENIMLVQQLGRPDFVKVLDFGVAKVAPAPGTQGQTAIGMVIGTPQYMSPEQAAGVAVDARSDVYALGLILYELITGRPAFAAETPSILLALQMTAAPQPFSPGPLEDTPELEALVHAMLAKKPSARPASMDAVLNGLEALPQGGKKGSTTRVAPATVQEAALTLAAPRTMAAPAVETLMAPAATPPSSRTEFSPRVQPRMRAAEPEVEELAIPRKSPWPWIFAAAVVLGGGGGFGWMALRPSAPAPAPVLAPAKAEAPKPVPVAALTFETRPPGAEVYDGDFLLGVTPFTLQREKGTVVDLRFLLKDYEPQGRKVRFEENARVSIELERAKAAEAAPPVAEKKPKKAARQEAAPAQTKPPSSELKELPF